MTLVILLLALTGYICGAWYQRVAFFNSENNDPHLYISQVSV